jgi:hypothetical protein
MCVQVPFTQYGTNPKQLVYSTLTTPANANPLYRSSLLHIQCCQVLRRLFRQLNQNLPLFGEKAPLFIFF